MSSYKKISSFKKSEIHHLFKTATLKTNNSGLLIKSAPKQAEHARMLLVVSKKTGSAVIRNKLKRQLKAIFYQNNLFAIPHDLVVIALPAAVKLSYDDLNRILCNSVLQ